MKADLRKYKSYTILYNAHKTESGLYIPAVTLFKSGEETLKLEFKRTFEDRDQALSFALGAGDAVVDAKIKDKKPDISLIVGKD